MRADWSLMRDRRFARLFCARTASMGGSAFAPVALAFGVLHLPGGDSELLSIVLTAESVPMIVFLLIVWLYDFCMTRLERRHGLDPDD